MISRIRCRFVNSNWSPCFNLLQFCSDIFNKTFYGTLPSLDTMTIWRETGKTRRERDDDMQQKLLAGVTLGTSRLHGHKPQDVLLQTFIYPVLGSLDTNNPPATPCFMLTHPVNKLLLTTTILSVGHWGAQKEQMKFAQRVVGNERPTVLTDIR